AIAFAPVQKVLGLNDVRAAARSALPDHDETIGIGEGKRAQQHRMDHAEYGSGSADAERQHRYRGDGECRRLAQQAQREACVADRALQGCPAPRLPRILANQRDVAKVAPRAHRVLAAIAPELLFLREVKTQLFIELPFFAGAAPKLHGTSYAGFMMRPTA